jgi:hypothetical protein
MVLVIFYYKDEKIGVIKNDQTRPFSLIVQVLSSLDPSTTGTTFVWLLHLHCSGARVRPLCRLVVPSKSEEFSAVGLKMRDTTSNSAAPRGSTRPPPLRNKQGLFYNVTYWTPRESMGARKPTA